MTRIHEQKIRVATLIYFKRWTMKGKEFQIEKKSLGKGKIKEKKFLKKGKRVLEEIRKRGKEKKIEKN